MRCNNNKKFKKAKSKKFKKNKFSAAERRAYLIGLGRGARVITGKRLLSLSDKKLFPEQRERFKL